MSHGVTGTNGMAYSTNNNNNNNVRTKKGSLSDAQLMKEQARSFTTPGSAATTQSKSTGHTLNPSYGGTSTPWGSGSIWSNGNYSNGLSSRATTRDNSRSRDSAQTSDAEVIEGKTGSGSLVESSVSDGWSYKTAWGGKRSAPSAQSISHARFPETPATQQRSASNAGLPQAFSTSTQNFSSLASRPPTISLNTTVSAQSRSGFSSAFSSGYPGRGSEQPPRVYTKNDRPTDPNARKLPDSAKGGCWADSSPIDERKPPQFPMQYGRTASMPASRDGSLPPPRHGDEQSFFNTPDYSRTSQRPTQNSSRAPSQSSQGAGPYNAFPNANPDQVAFQLDQLNLNGDMRSFTSHRPSGIPNGGYGQPPPTTGASSFSRASLSGVGSGIEGPDESGDYDRGSLNYLGSDDYVSPHQTPIYPEYSNTNFGNRLMQTPNTAEFRPGQTYANGLPPPRAYDVPTGPRSTSGWQSLTNGTTPPSRRSPTLTEQAAYLDPRMQQVLAAQLRNPYANIYNPYALPGALQLGAMSPYGPLSPMSLPGVDPAAVARDATVRDGLQSSVLYDFKSNIKSRRWELKDIFDHIAEFSGDQHGSRFIQTKLETANSDEKERVFREIEPNAIPLMTDVFGNYVIQKFFEHGDQTHKKILANKMKGQVLSLSLQMYGCRVVQKALDHVLVDQQVVLISELDNQVLKCVKDQNGNHVIQKAIERCPSHAIRFIFDAFQGQVQHLSIHPYGCRVIQRCLERCDPPSKARIMAELMDGMQSMISDQYGNYVVQHVVEHDEHEGRRRVLNIVGKTLEAYSKHKFASNVVEKCLEKADDGWRRDVVFSLANGNPRRGEGEGVLVGLIKDNFGNYVIRKSLSSAQVAAPC